MLNPKLKDFLEEKKDITMLGIAWACYWRLSIVIMLVYLLLLGFAVSANI